MFEQEREPHRPGRKGLVVVVAIVLVLAGAFITSRLWAPAPGEHPVETTPVPAPPAVVAPQPPPGTAKPETPAEEPALGRRRVPRPEPKPAPATQPATPATGEVTIETDVPGAMIFLDREYLGTAPVTAHNVSPGQHHVNASATGYDGYSESIDVAPGPSTVLIRFNEVRLHATVDVVHKHGIGSCEGRLVATPDSISYETTNKSDAFTMRREDVETFEVDYLKKNLRIKKKGGKTYNFTTKANSSDPLFAFHRDVQKAWERMKAGSAK
jgi:hypothetical protein